MKSAQQPSEPVPQVGPDKEMCASAGSPSASAETPVGRLAATVERLRREVRSAHAAADGRALIEVAKGVLIERLQCSPAQASRQLSLLADQAGVPQLELAADIINQSANDRLTEITNDLVLNAADDPQPHREKVPAAVRLRTAESGALAAEDTQAVAESLLEHALGPLGAHAVAVWDTGADGSLTLAGHAGFTVEEATRWRYVPPGVATVARQALADRALVRIPTPARSKVPSIGQMETPDAGRIAVPAGTGGRILGVLEICWPNALPAPSPQIDRQIEALAELCAHTLETHGPAASATATTGRGGSFDADYLREIADSLYDPALVLRPCLDDEGRLVDFRIHHVNAGFVDPAGRPHNAISGTNLLEAYPRAADAHGLFEHIERVYATGERFRSQRMTLTALVDQVPLTSVADINVSRHGDGILLIWRIEDEAARLANLLRHAQRLGRIGGFEEDTTTREITWNDQLFALYGQPLAAGPIPLEELPAYAHPDDALAIGRFLRTVLHRRRPASTAFRLRRPDGVTRHIRVVAEPVLDPRGRLLSLRGAYQDISSQHWTEVALAATRDQLAHSQEQSAERTRLALQLQHAIMPPTTKPLVVPGLQTAVRYRPAETDTLVGGDWYDTVALPSGKIFLCVGDVAGHGIKAATSMVVLRNALRGLAVTGAGPGQLLTWLNIVAHHLTDQVTATAVCGLYDREERTLRWARAGHLPPVLVRSGQASVLPPLSGILLGAVEEATYEEAELELRADDTLVMYTDGLVERRDDPNQDSLRQLLTMAQGSAAGPLEHQLDQLLTYSTADTDDDTCVIGIRPT
ncbi:SpoIIE family protein phosphatase [Streptomyces sp. NPDC090798]|uniref:SpoIIE family protein phosphatase n=1 Tax=Streptomyces sp. NPDC090798 TaxID=3365968 RepID=UPI00380FA3DE